MSSSEPLYSPPVQPPMPTKRRWIERVVVLIVAAALGFAGGIAGSAMHQGPQGPQGPRGTRGRPGLAGPRGPAGSAAVVSSLGLCVNSSPVSFTGGSGTFHSVESTFITSPSKRPDGVIYCPSGVYVPVAAQATSTGG